MKRTKYERGAGRTPTAQGKHLTEDWTEEELTLVIKEILCNGHLNTDEILRDIPTKSKDMYAKLLRSAKDMALATERPSDIVERFNAWLQLAEKKSSREARQNGPLEIAMALHLLSLDGVIDKHPLPESCGNVDYGACYRLLSQAVLGHPIQPVNQATLDLLYGVFMEVNSSAVNSTEVIKKLKDLLVQEGPTAIDQSSRLRAGEKATKAYGKKTVESKNIPKPIRTFSRKKRVTESVASEPGQSEEVTASVSSDTPSSLPSSSQSIPDWNDNLTESEREIYESKDYNPFELPLDWLRNSEVTLKKASSSIVGKGRAVAIDEG